MLFLSGSFNIKRSTTKLIEDWLFSDTLSELSTLEELYSSSGIHQSNPKTVKTLIRKAIDSWHLVINRLHSAHVDFYNFFLIVGIIDKSIPRSLRSSYVTILTYTIDLLEEIHLFAKIVLRLHTQATYSAYFEPNISRKQKILTNLFFTVLRNNKKI